DSGNSVGSSCCAKFRERLTADDISSSVTHTLIYQFRTGACKSADGHGLRRTRPSRSPASTCPTGQRGQKQVLVVRARRCVLPPSACYSAWSRFRRSGEQVFATVIAARTAVSVARTVVSPIFEASPPATTVGSAVAA